MSYQVNWTKTPAGNGIKENTSLDIRVLTANHISAAVYVAGLPVIVGFSKGDHLKLLLSRKGMDLSGPATLKVRAGVNGSIKGYDDEFLII